MLPGQLKVDAGGMSMKAAGDLAVLAADEVTRGRHRTGDLLLLGSEGWLPPLFRHAYRAVASTLVVTVSSRR
jgi:hypothetical protein